MQRKLIPEEQSSDEKEYFAIKDTVADYFITILNCAMKKKSNELISFLQKNIVSIDVIIPTENYKLQTPISYLASKNERSAVMFLLRHGANINYAMIGAKNGEHNELALELQKYGASPHSFKIGEYMNLDKYNYYNNDPDPHWPCEKFSIIIDNVNKKPGIKDINKNVMNIYGQFLSAAALGGYFQWLNQTLDEQLLDNEYRHSVVSHYFNAIIEGAAAGGHYALVDSLIDKVNEICPEDIMRYLKKAMNSYANHGYLDSAELILKLLSQIKEPARRQKCAELADARFEELNNLSTILYQRKNEAIREFGPLLFYSEESEWKRSDLEEHEEWIRVGILKLKSIRARINEPGYYEMMGMHHLLSVIEDKNYNIASFTNKTTFRHFDLKPQIFPKVKKLLSNKENLLQFKNEYKLPLNQAAWLSDEVHGLLTSLINKLPNELNAIIMSYLLIMPVTIIPQPIRYYFLKEKLLYDLMNIDSSFSQFFSYIKTLFCCQTKKEREEILFLMQLKKSMPIDENQFYELLTEGSKKLCGNKKRLMIDNQSAFFKIKSSTAHEPAPTSKKLGYDYAHNR